MLTYAFCALLPIFFSSTAIPEFPPNSAGGVCPPPSFPAPAQSVPVEQPAMCPVAVPVQPAVATWLQKSSGLTRLRACARAFVPAAGPPTSKVASSTGPIHCPTGQPYKSAVTASATAKGLHALLMGRFVVCFFSVGVRLIGESCVVSVLSCI